MKAGCGSAQGSVILSQLVVFKSFFLTYFYHSWYKKDVRPSGTSENMLPNLSTGPLICFFFWQNFDSLYIKMKTSPLSLFTPPASSASPSHPAMPRPVSPPHSGALGVKLEGSLLLNVRPPTSRTGLTQVRSTQGFCLVALEGAACLW